MNTVSLRVNTTNLIQNLRYSFTNSTTVLSELIQNARRAGATAVHFDISEDRLVVSDNGGGIASMKTLFTVAESGWSEDVKNTEGPFGMGWFSTLYAAKTVTVESRGKMVSFDTADVLSFSEIPELDTDFAGGTRITMEGLSLTTTVMKEAVNNFAFGYAIPVYVNGEKCERLHAIDVLPSVVATEVGEIYISGATEGNLIEHVVVYLQGIRVYSTNSYKLRSDWVNVVHLDSTCFKGRMPDRDTLVDQDAVIGMVKAALLAEQAKILQSLRQSLGDAEFVNRLWNTVTQLGLKSMLNTIDILPAVAVIPTAYPTLIETWNRINHDKAITRQEIESGAVILHSGNADIEEPAAEMLAYKLGWLQLNPTSLDKDHWAQRHIVPMEHMTVDVALVEQEAGTQQIQGARAWASVSFCKEIRIDATVDTGAEGSSPRNFSVTFADDAMLVSECQFAVPAGVGPCQGSHAVGQTSSYTDEHDSFVEADYDNDRNELEIIINSHRNQDPVALLTTLLRQADIVRFSQLHAKQFLLSIDADGKLQVNIHP